MNEAGNIFSTIKQIRNWRAANKPIKIDDLELANYQSKLIAEEGNPATVVDVVRYGGTAEQGRASAFREKDVAKENFRKIAEEAAEQKRISRYFDSEIARHWNSTKSKDIETSARLGMSADDAAASATLEAVVRNARKLGWTTEHTSTGSSGRKSSRYLISPDGTRKVRVSDHYLPDTPSREYNRSIGLTGKWDDEIVTSDWRSSSLGEYLKRLAGEE